MTTDTAEDWGHIKDEDLVEGNDLKNFIRDDEEYFLLYFWMHIQEQGFYPVHTSKAP